VYLENMLNTRINNIYIYLISQLLRILVLDFSLMSHMTNNMLYFNYCYVAYTHL